MSKSLISVSIPEFKSQNNIASFQVLKNKATDKLFVATDSGKTFRCQQDIDFTKPMNFIGEDLANLCLVNMGRGAEILQSF